MPSNAALRGTIGCDEYTRRTCTNCGRTGHLATTCVHPVGAIDRIGIEIEGYWRDINAAKRLARTSGGCTQGLRDGSLPNAPGCECSIGEHCDCGDDDCTACERPVSGCECGQATPWEFQTKAGTLGEQCRRLQVMYPTHTSNMCGLHVHFSFKSDYLASVSLLASEEFFRHWNARWVAWGNKLAIIPGSAFWQRLTNGGLTGETKYCKVNTENDWFTTGAPSEVPHAATPSPTNRHDRYRQINFASWGDSGRKTVEFRLLPMFQKASLSISAIEECVDIVETYLATARCEIAVQPTPEHVTLYTGRDPDDEPTAEGELFVEIPEIPGSPCDLETVAVDGYDAPDRDVTRVEIDGAVPEYDMPDTLVQADGRVLLAAPRCLVPSAAQAWIASHT